MSSCNLFQVNDQTPISDIIDYLINGVSSTEDGIIFMQNLYETQPAISNKTLCEFFNVACFQIGESCFKDSHPVEEHHLWFVSTSADDPTPFPIVKEIPYGKSEAEAQCIAVKYLKLKELFFASEND